MKNQPQCPNCKQYKMRSIAGVCVMVGILSLIFIITAPAGLLLFGVAYANRGKYKCGNCGLVSDLKNA